jgi:hypothetical protein
LGGEMSPTGRDPSETDGSTVAKWAVVLIVGEICLALFAVVLGSVLRIGEVWAIIAAFALAILIAGRAGGLRGLVEWVIAAVLIVAAAGVLLYLLIGVVVSQMTGP